MADTLKHTAKLPILSIITSSLLVLSVAYDYSYLNALNLSFAEVPTTISDHIRSSLIWFPLLFIGLGLYFIIEMIFRRTENGMSEEEIIDSSKNKKFIKIFREIPRYIIISIALVVLIGYFFGVDYKLSALQFSIIIVWFLIFEYIFSHERIIEQFPSRLSILYILVVGAIFIYVLFQGAIDAKNDLLHKNSCFITANNQKIEKVLLRSFEHFFLVYDNKSKYIDILFTSDITSVDINTTTTDKGTK